MPTQEKPTGLITTAQVLFLLNAVIWLIFGVVSLGRMSSNGNLSPVTALVIAILMFGNTVAMALGGLALRRKNRWFYLFTVLVIVVNIILTFTDQFGLLDLVTLIIDVILLGILIIVRSWYWNGETAPALP